METYDQFIDSGLSWDEFEATALKPEEPDDYDAFIDSGLSWDEYQAKVAPTPAPVTPADREPIYAELGLPVPSGRFGKPPEEYTEEMTAKRLGKQAVISVGQGVADIARFAKATAETRKLDDPMPFPKYTGWERDPAEPKPGPFRGAFDVAATTTYDQRQFGSTLRDIAEIEGSNPSPDRIDEEWEKYLKSKQTTAIQEAQDFIDMFPEIMEGSSGIVEDALTGMARFLPTMGISAVNPIAGTVMTFTQIAGSSYDEYRKQGIDPDKAFNVAMINSLVQTPLEMAGNLLQIRALRNVTKSLGRSVGIGARLERFSGALLAGAVGEGGEEFLQQYPDEISSIYIANPDLTPEEIAKLVWEKMPEITKKGKKAMVVGAVGGLMLTGGIQTLSIPTDLSSYISEKQAKINKEKGVMPEEAPAEGVSPPPRPTPSEEAGLPPGYVLASAGEEGAILFGRADGPPVYAKKVGPSAEEAAPPIEEIQAKYDDGTFTDEDIEDHKVIFGDDPDFVAALDEIVAPVAKEAPVTKAATGPEMRTALLAKLKAERPDIADADAAVFVDDVIARTEEFIPIEDEADPAEFSVALAKEEGQVLPGSAAIKIGDKVYGPAQTHLQVVADIPNLEELVEELPVKGEEAAAAWDKNVTEGFLTDKGVFVDRKKALTLVPPDVAKGKKGELRSEDLAEFSIAPATATDIKEELKLTQFKRKSPEDSYAIRKGRARVGHIVGESSEVTKQSNIFKDNPDLGLKVGDTYYRIHNTRLEKEHRGKGIYQEKIQEIANKYDAGALVHKFEASPALQNALRKMPGVVETDKVIRIPAKVDEGFKEAKAALEFKAEDIDALRKATVKRALAEGKVVPEEVLKDYPDLQAKEPARKAPSAPKLSLKRHSPGLYSGKIGNTSVQLYRAESGKYWSSTITVGEYGSAEYVEEIIQGESKRGVLKDINKFIESLVSPAKVIEPSVKEKEKGAIAYDKAEMFLDHYDIDSAEIDGIYLVGARGKGVGVTKDSDWDFVVVGEDFTKLEDFRLKDWEAGELPTELAREMDTPVEGRGEFVDIIFDSKVPPKGRKVFPVKKPAKVVKEPTQTIHLDQAEFSVAVAAETKITGKQKQKDLKKTLTLIEGGKYEYLEERQKRILEQAEFVREEDAKNEAAAQIVTIKNDRFPQQTISTIVEAQAWLKENGFPQIAEKGQTAKLIKRLVKDENFQKLNIFDKTRVAAQLERVIREYDYKPVIAIGGNAKTKGLLGTKGIGEIEIITGSGIRIADCVAGCDHYCFECYALKGAAQGQKCHQHPILAKLTSYLKTGEVLRIGEKGDPSRAWGHTNEQIRLMLARSEKRKQDVSPDNIYFTTKLLNLEGFDPQIQRHLQVTLDPLFPDHMIRTMENILRVKAAHPDVVIVARIRSIHTTNKDLNESTQAAVEFANQYKLPILETRMRFIRKSSFDVLELDKTKYKWDGSQYKMTTPALKEESEDYHLCDVKNKSCPACKNCVKLVQSRKKLIPKQTKAIKAAGIDNVSIAASQAFDPVGLTEEGLVPEFSLKPEPEKGRLSPAQKVLDIITPIIKTWTNFPVVRVVQNTNSLPKRLRNQAVAQERKTKGKVEGLYDPQTDQVFLIADNLAEGRIEDVLRHEAEGHRGLRLMMGTGLDSFLDKVAAAKQAELLAMAPGLNLKDKAAVRRVANEWAARHIEAGTMKPLWHGRLVYAFKQWLRKLFPGLKMTDADIKTALYDVVMNVRYGKPGILGKGDTTTLASEKAEEWFRQMDQVLERKLPKTGTAASYIQAIESYVKKGDFKQEELEWSGIMDWLKDNKPVFALKDPKGKLSKQDILDYLYYNNVRIEEIVRSDRDIELEDDVQDRIDYLNSLSQDEITVGETWELDELLDMYSSKQEAAALLPTKYSAYTLSGGTDYKELILRMPKGIGPEHMVSIVADGEDMIVRGKRMAWEDAVMLYAPELDLAALRTLRMERGKIWFMEHLQMEVLPEIRVKLGATKKSPAGFTDKFGHADNWDTDNILAHIRFDTRIGPNGERILHIAEIQSDWHQEARTLRNEKIKALIAGGMSEEAARKAVPADYGYVDPTFSEEKEDAFLRAQWELTNKLRAEDNLGFDSYIDALEAIREYDDFATRWEMSPATVKLGEKYRKLRAERKEAESGVPQAPFKGTQVWSLLAMKRMTRYAAENNFDVISWDTGQTNADRYNLSKHVNKIIWYRKGDKYSIQALPIAEKYEAHEYVDVAHEIPAGEIEKYLGKDVADKITTSTEEEYLDVPSGLMMQEGEISGVDLEVGGEGMVAFYDKMIPNIVNKFFNKATWGKAKVGTIDLEKGSAGLDPRQYKGPEVDLAKVYYDRDTGVHDRSPALHKQIRQIAIVMREGKTFKAAMEEFGSIRLAEFYGGSLMSPYKKATVHALPVTPEMKTKAIHEGMPLFREQVQAEYPHPTKTTESKGIIFIGADGMGADIEGKPSPYESFRYADYHKAWTLDKAIATQIHDRAQDGYTHIAVVTYKHVRNSMRNHPHFTEALRRALREKHGEKGAVDFIKKGQAEIDRKNAALEKEGKDPITNISAEYMAAVTLKGLPRGETISIARGLAVDDWKTRGGKIIGIGVYGEQEDVTDPREVYTGKFTFDSYHELPTPIDFSEFMTAIDRYKELKQQGEIWIAMQQRGFVLNKKAHPMATKLMAGATGEFKELQAELEEQPELTPEVAINVHFSTAKQELTARQRALLEKHYPAKLAAMDKKTGGTIIEKSKEDFEHFAGMGEMPSSPEGFNMPHEGVGRQVFDTIQFKIQDRFNSLKRVQDVIERQITPLTDATNVHQVEELYHGIVSERVGVFDSEHVDGLIEAIHESGFDLEEVEAYLYARHAKEANAQLEKINPKVKDNKALSGLSNEDAAEILAQHEGNQAMQDIAARIDAITKAGRKILVEEGLATADQVAAWENIYKYYIPLKREGKIAGMPKKGQGVNIAGPESKRRLTGSAERRAVNIVANVVSQHEAIIIRAEKAKVGRAMLKLAEAFPNKELWEVDAKQLKPHLKQRSSEKIDDETGLPQTLNEVVLGKDILYKFNDNVLVVKVDGKERTITFNEQNVHAQRMVRGLKNLGAQDMNAFVGTLAKVNRWLAVVNTSLNPEFIISNFARDIQTAGYNISDTAAKNMKRKVFKDVGKAWWGIRKGLKGDFSSEWAQDYRAFAKAGAQTGWTDHYKNIESREKSLMKKLDLMKDGTFRSMKRGTKGLMDFISNENTAVENAIRLSVYKHLKDAGASDAVAASAAKNLTVNFNRRGDMGQTLNAMYLFFNANVQGSARLIYAASRSKKVRRMMYATVAFAVMLDILNRTIGGEDDDGENRYDKVPPWVKEHNLVLMRGNGDYFKIPLPWGYNTLHVLGQSIGEAVDPNADEFDTIAAAARFGSAILGSFNPLGSESTLLQLAAPTIADPFVQWAQNKNFAGIPIKPEQMPFDVPKPEYQLYFQSARKPSRWIAKMLSDATGGDEIRPGLANVSPEVIDLFLETMMGGAGRFMENTLALPAEFAKKKPEVRKMPGLRKIYGEAPDYYLRTKFYDNLSEIRYAQKSVDHYEDNPARLSAVKREYSWESRFIKRAKRDKKKIGDLRKKRKKIEAGTESERVKEAKLQAIEKQITQIMTAFNRTYKRRTGGAYMTTTPSMGAPYTPSTGLTLREAMQIK